jgi:predicted aldo/keto reductase-like oxidoreductase
MKYRKFGKLDWEISEVSLGVLRQEEAVAARGEINGRERVKAIRYAVDQGVNYINMGFPCYFDNPQEACGYVKEALSGGYRDKVKAAINIPSRGISSRQELDKALDGALRQFGLDKADFCMIEGVNRATWGALKSIDIASWASEASGSGKADHIGLAFHDDPHYLKDITEAYPQWAVIQIELSILDYRHHPGVGCFKFAEEHDIAVIATDITKAGRLLRNIPPNVRELLDKAPLEIDMEERCLRWVLSFDDVSSAQMSVQAEFNTAEQVRKYLAFMERMSPGDVDIWEVLDDARIREAYYANRDCPCSYCRCCMPCSYGVDIPRINELLNDEKMFSDSKIPKFQYNLENHQNAKCAQCSLCNRQCPKGFQLQRNVNEAYEKYANK